MNSEAIFSIIFWFGALCFGNELQDDSQCGIMNPNGEFVKNLNSNGDTPRPSAIIGGDYARAGEFPFQVSIITYSRYWPWTKATCGGTVISKRCVLTAAHCFFLCPEYKQKSVVATFGATNLNGEYRQSLTSYDFVIHDDYKPCKTTIEEHGSDIAIIKFSEDIEMGMTENGKKSVGKVCLAFGNSSDTFSIASVTGWGHTYSGDSLTRSNKLKIAELQRDDCDDRLSGKHICAANKFDHQTACYGDSGGPLFTVKNGKAVQIGIVNSIQEGCPVWGINVFARVKSYEAWIKKHCDI